MEQSMEHFENCEFIQNYTPVSIEHFKHCKFMQNHIVFLKQNTHLTFLIKGICQIDDERTIVQKTTSRADHTDYTLKSSAYLKNKIWRKLSASGLTTSPSCTINTPTLEPSSSGFST